MTDEAEIVQIIGFLDDVISAANGYKDALFGGLISLLKIQHKKLSNTMVSFSNAIKTHEAFLQQKGLYEKLKTAKTSIFERLNELDTRIAEHLTGVEEQDFAKDPETYRALFVEYGFEDCLERLKDTVNCEIDALKALSKPRGRRYFDIVAIDDTSKDYQAALQKYSAWKKHIAQTIEDIRTATEYIDKLHRPMEHGKWKGVSHARISENLRLMYVYNPADKKLTLLDIIKHDEM
jgi:mRNA-degrading endonuclease YafQ of YafQ-DinJ toxin-antitoxin module